MTSVVLYFQVHQPWRLRRYTFFDIGRDSAYFDDALNVAILRRVADRCYLPVNRLLLREIERSEGAFRCAFSVSGTALEQMETWTPEVVESFRALAATGCVEFLAETSHHSLAFLGDRDEFRAQVAAQRTTVERLIGTVPKGFRNTELVLHDDVARAVEELGFDVLLGEGADHVLGFRDPHRVYRPSGCERLKLLLRSYRFSDDIAFRFSDRGWSEWPLSPEKFAGWLAELPAAADCVGLFMDYETAGEHQWADSGILDFLAALPRALRAHRRFRFATPSEAAAQAAAREVVAVPGVTSWADAERDLSAWLGNEMQRAAHAALYELLPAVRACGDPRVLDDWRRLSTSDHVYYMSTKYASDGDVHAYFSHWDTPHDAFIAFMNVLEDLERRTRRPRTARRARTAGSRA